MVSERPKITQWMISDRYKMIQWDEMARLDGFLDIAHLDAVIDWYGEERFFFEAKSTTHLQEFYAKLRHDYEDHEPPGKVVLLIEEPKEAG